MSCLHNPTHPYTQALLSAPSRCPDIRKKLDRVILKGEITIPIEPPKLPAGLQTAARMRQTAAASEEPQLKEISPGHFVSCFLAE